MRLRSLLAFAAVALAAPAGATPAGAAPPPRQVQAPSPQARDLATLVTPLDVYVDREANMLRQFFLALPASDPDARALEEEYPGFHADIWRAIEPKFRMVAVRAHPDVIAGFAGVYQQLLSPDQMTALQTFYETDAGRRVLGAAHAADRSAMLNEMLADPEAPISGGAIAAVQRSAVAKAVAEMRSTDEAAAIALGEAIPWAKTIELQSALQALTLQMVNEPSPEMEADIEKIVIEAMDNYFAGKGAVEP